MTGSVPSSKFQLPPCSLLGTLLSPASDQDPAAGPAGIAAPVRQLLAAADVPTANQRQDEGVDFFRRRAGLEAASCIRTRQYGCSPVPGRDGEGCFLKKSNNIILYYKENCKGRCQNGRMIKLLASRLLEG
jgi:hypothetical protein